MNQLLNVDENVKVVIYKKIDKDIVIIMNELVKNIQKIHTTPLGKIRIQKNLNISMSDPVVWCKDIINKAESIIRRGKNWYVHYEDIIITVNAHSFTIITAHRAKKTKSI